MNTLKSVLLSTSLLMTAPFAAADVEQGDLAGAQAQCAETEAAFENFKHTAIRALKSILFNNAGIREGDLQTTEKGPMFDSLMALKKTLETLKAQERQLTTKIAGLETDLATAKGRYGHLDNAMRDLKSANAEAGEQSLKTLRQLESERDTAKAERDAAKSALTAKEHELARLTAELAQTKSLVATTNGLMDEKYKAFKEASEALTAKEQERARLTAELAKAKDALAAKEQEVANLTRELAKAKDAAAAEVFRLNKEIERLGEVVKNRESESSRSNRGETAAKEQLADAVARECDLKAATAAKEADIVRLTAELAGAKAERDAAKADAAAKQADIAQLTAKFKETNNALGNAMLNITRRTEELNQKDAELKAAKNELAAKEQLVKEIQARERELISDRAQQKADFNARERELAADKEKLAKELEVVKQELTKANSKSAAAEAREGVLTAANAELAAELDALRLSQATNSVARPLSYDGSGVDAAATARLRMLAGANPSQHSRSEVTFSDGHSVGSFRGNAGNAGGKPDISEMSPVGDSADTTPANTPAKTSQAKQGDSTHPLLQKDDPLVSDDDADRTSQLASPGAAAVETVEDQIAKLKAELDAAQAIVDKPELAIVAAPGRNAKQATIDRYNAYVNAKAELDQAKAAATEDVKRLKVELAALEQAQPAGK